MKGVKLKTGVLLVNLGSPEEPTESAVRAFLRDFLSDRRVVEIPRILWLPLLYGLILPFRPGKVTRKYQSIWSDSGSPLRVNTETLADAVSQSVGMVGKGDTLEVRSAYSYGQPGIAETIHAMQDSGCSRLLVIPMYPQFSSTTTGPVYDQVAELWGDSRDHADCRIIKNYFNEPGWSAAIADSISNFRREHGTGDALLFSYHGIPQRNVDLGDPYQTQCEESSRLIVEHLNLEQSKWHHAYQSRFGRARWLTPDTSNTLVELARSGVQTVDVVCPSFAVDCLETLEEIVEENAEIFVEAGGRELRYIPCLNHSDEHVFFFRDLIQRELNLESKIDADA